jgi:hypothetical protein
VQGGAICGENARARQWSVKGRVRATRELMAPWSALSRFMLKMALSCTWSPPPSPSLKLKPALPPLKQTLPTSCVG